MKIVIHRGTHQIGGVATEIRTSHTCILIDMGDELSLDLDFQSRPLSIPGVTDGNGTCDAVLFTHNHGDHVGQINRIREDIPLWMGPLAKEVLLCSLVRQKKDEAVTKVNAANCLDAGKALQIGDITVTPFSIDHSACDSYMFLIEAEGKRILHTGDFRLHGFRGKAIPKIIKKVGKVDVLITEGTTLSRPDTDAPTTERELQQKAEAYMAQYKYVFVLAASTNLERICALAKAVPSGKYFLCDDYQSELIDLVQKHWDKYSPLYRDIKKLTYSDNLLDRFKQRGFLMMVRDNYAFRQIVPKFDRDKSIMLYSMWDGYRTKPDSTIPAFLDLAGTWETLHTSGHASKEDIQSVISLADPSVIIPMHTEQPDSLTAMCPGRSIVLLQDGEEYEVL